MIRAAFVIFIIFAAFLACVYHNIIPWRHLEGDAIAEAVKAAEQWCVATDGACCARIGEGEGEVSLRYQTWSECQWSTGLKCVASYSWKKRRIRIVFGAHRTLDSLRRTVLHELGHHCGIRGHSEVIGAVMWQGSDAGWRITTEDLRLFNEGMGPND